MNTGTTKAHPENIRVYSGLAWDVRVADEGLSAIDDQTSLRWFAELESRIA